jgi:hypothetical protein
MTQTRFKIILTALTVVVLAVLSFLAYLDYRLRPAGSWQCENGAWRKVGDPRGLPPETGCVAAVAKPAPGPDCETLVTKDAKADEAYWRTGRLGRHEPCMKGDTWYLKYSRPDGARLLELTFAPDAACSVDGVKADCAKMNPPAGSQTSMNGVSDGAFLRLSQLEFRTK